MSEIIEPERNEFEDWFYSRNWRSFLHRLWLVMLPLVALIGSGVYVDSHYSGRMVDDLAFDYASGGWARVYLPGAVIGACVWLGILLFVHAVVWSFKGLNHGGK